MRTAVVQLVWIFVILPAVSLKTKALDSQFIIVPAYNSLLFSMLYSEALATVFVCCLYPNEVVFDLWTRSFSLGLVLASDSVEITVGSKSKQARLPAATVGAKSRPLCLPCQESMRYSTLRKSR